MKYYHKMSVKLNANDNLSAKWQTDTLATSNEILFLYLLTALRYFWSVQAYVIRYDKNRIVLRTARQENQKQDCRRRHKDNNIFQICYRNIKDDHAKM